MASRNKMLGRKAESKFVTWFADKFGLIKLVKSKSGANLGEAEVGRAEDVSQLLDNTGVDIWFKPGTSLDNLNVQIKSTLATGKTMKSINVQALFEMPDDKINVLITEINYRPGKRNRIHYGDVVTMSLEDFRKILSVYSSYKLDDNSRKDQEV